ncbi:YafY family transcriptional regulator [Rhodobacter sp. Har01]|uniref:helix-turn-helix transcriptional regulator n=1 Tax=Rhodobacter sp. Har01 TaxID=2883999 RepID=UPI001D067C54|nr:YafY family protein [Rhodobacter sp. Har01]MCB6176894.1 YafY family transcriptional regulator [Rhodobacter sp. Har01]
MARADRLFRLLDVLRRLPQPVTAARLAAETSVSLRTLYRDIDALRAGGARIEGAAGLGYTLAEDPALPPQMFTRLEVEALVMGLAEVRLAGDAELARAADLALAKIVATLPERVQRQAIHATHQVYRGETRPPAPPHMALVRQAAWDERALDIAYRDRDGSLTRRRIWPLALVYLDSALMCLAWCCLRQDFRRFHLSEMSEVRLAEDSFRPRRVALLRRFIDQLRAGVRPASGRSR